MIWIKCVINIERIKADVDASSLSCATFGSAPGTDTHNFAIYSENKIRDVVYILSYHTGTGGLVSASSINNFCLSAGIITH